MAVVVLAAFGLYATYAVSRLQHFRAATYDLVIFDQAVRSYAHLQPGIAPVKGVHNDFGPYFSVLGDHFSPILAVLAPLYWIHDRPITLVLAQAALFALAIPFVWVFTRRLLGPAAAYLVAVAFAVSGPIQAAVAFDVHEVAFAVPLMAIAYERLQAERYGQAGVAAVALLLVKEDMGFFLFGFGALLVVLRGPHRRPEGSDRGQEQALWRWFPGVVAMIAGIVAVWLTTQVLMPAAGGRPGYYWQYAGLGATPGAGLRHVLHHPVQTLALFVTPDGKVQLLLWLLAPLAFCSLASPYVLPAVPLLAERLLASNPNWWAVWPHYNAFVVVILFCAGVDGAARLARLWVARYGTAQRVAGTGWAAFACAATLVTALWFPFHNLAHASWWTASPRQRAAAAAVAKVPDGVTVEAMNYLGPALSGRCDVRLLDRTPRGAPWVVLDTAHRSFPFVTLAEQRHRLPYLEAHGYREVFRSDGYVVLRKGGR
ncbi:MAG: DUF2079 domain-containing protein [Streptosporangiales bacterium]|nr:DUF2079 domain-containing protein [Streptosporangiales bacterium]MBO0890174.1 DUF2079 domain-containing protein [Acidothermales bacterium]